MTDALVIAKQKDAIIEARGQSQRQVVGTRKYTIHLKDGRSFICIDLVNDDPDEVERKIRVQFSHYGVVRVER